MPDSPYFPSLSDLIKPENLPAELGVVKQAFTDFLDHFYYRDLQVHRSTNGDAAFYSLKILTYKRLALEVPGTGGLALILNPALDASVQGSSSELHFSLRYKWGILGYVKDFSIDSFADSAAAFFDVILDITGVTKEELLAEALSVLTDDPDPILQFINLFNGDPNYAALVPLQLNSFPTDEETIADLLLQLVSNGNDFDAYQIILDHYITTAASSVSSLGDISHRLELLFQKWMGRFSQDKLKELFIPRASAAIDELRVGIQFPRAILREVDAKGKPIPDPEHPGEDKPALLAFGLAALRYSTEIGLQFDLAQSLDVSVPRCEILKSGLILDIHDLKIDYSRTTNIPEATADGRPVDFVGVYVRDGTISFPASWNQDLGSTAKIKARNLLIGTGGFSGTLALEAAVANVPKPVVKVRFGDDFSISLDKFLITFKQNAITGSTIEGTLVIPGFKDSLNNPAEIRIKVAIRQNGDFDVTAHEDEGFKPIEVPGVFILTVKSVFFGKTDDDFYLGVAGSIQFTHDLLKGALKDPIEIEKLKIWSDGRFEIEGGTIPLPKTARFPIGPAELSISAIHLGSHQRVEPDGSVINFRYFGFDAAMDINPGGLDVRGKGIKFYYPAKGTITEIKNLSYLEIKSLAIDMVIPGNVSKNKATLLISGFLSVDGSAGDPEYSGGITFSLPKMKIAGGAAMTYQPKVPAFLVDAFVELSTPIPLGPTGLGIFGFRGIFGQRFIATKTAGGVQETDTWFDYYKFKKNPPGLEGINTAKFENPGQTAGYDSTFSIGAGVSLATAQDSGKAFSCKLLLLLSLPDLIYLEGRANIVGERVGLTGDDPPFFAVLAITPQSVELGAGVNYKLPREGGDQGKILDLKAEMRAAFFFRNSSAWYVNIGTIQHPTTARILSLFDATSYLMLSASGIAAGAGVTWGFEKSYAGGMVRASVGVYIKVGGFISFERPQIGGFAMLGGHVDASLFWISFYIGIDTSLMVEVPHPFCITGSVHLCVGVTIGFWKFKKHIEKCFDVQFRWVISEVPDLTAVLPIADPAVAGTLPPAGATNMLSGETFRIADFGSSVPSPTDPKFNDAVLPLDTWVDLEFLKGLLPGPSVDARIGRLSGQAPGNIEYIPPAQVTHPVAHHYTINALEIRAWNGTAWADYRPYQAMGPPAALAVLAANPTTYKDGFWINMGDGGGLNKVRLLAETSLSYMQQPDWYVPEEMGITSTSLFCSGRKREEHCINWTANDAGTVCPDGKWRQMQTVFYRIVGGAGMVVDWTGAGGAQRSLAFANDDTAEIVLNQPCVKVSLKLTTFSSGAVIRFHAREAAGTTIAYTLVETRTLTQLELLAPVLYEQPNAPVAKVEIEPRHADPANVDGLLVQIDGLYRVLYESSRDVSQQVPVRIKTLEQELAQLRRDQCTPDGIGQNTLQPEIDKLKNEVEKCGKELAALQASQSEACAAATALQNEFEHCFPQEEVPCPDDDRLDCWRHITTTNDAGAQVSARDLYCALYKALYSRLYSENRKRRDELTKRCDDLTRALDVKRAECQALYQQLIAAEDAFTFAGQHGPLRPPQGFPCSTLLHEICWLSLEDYEYNATIPGQPAVAQDYANAVDAIEKRLTPIWRPGTIYSIRLEVQDTVNGSSQMPREFYFGFRTAGPVPCFHTDPSAGYVKPNTSPDKYLLTSLKGYIDYKRSYPNADGELIRAKPLFYEDARILLFFTKRYVYHFFGDWPAYNGLPALSGNTMQIVIKDPAEKTSLANPPPPNSITTEIPRAVISWPADDHPRIPVDVQTLLNLRNPELLNPEFAGGECWTSGGQMIKPASVYTSVAPQNLRPLRLYTVVVNNVYNGTVTEAHRYVCQTSRYADFKAQVRSYRLEDDDGNLRDAIFPLDVPLTIADVNLLYDIVSGNTSAPANAALAGTWADPFDRLVAGVLALPPLDAAIGTEFNIVRNSVSGAVVAVWIRNPEPFNDPKLPDDVLERSLRVLPGSTVDPSYVALFSKDRAQAFVMHPSRTIPVSKLKFRFSYIEWDGSDYVDHSVVTTGFVPTII